MFFISKKTCSRISSSEVNFLDGKRPNYVERAYRQVLCSSWAHLKAHTDFLLVIN